MNPEDSLAQTNAKELPWLAFLYVSEDLSPDEVVDFEERLLTDQAAREAVACAMKLADGVWLASALDFYGPKPETHPAAPALRANAMGHAGIFQRLSLWIAGTVAAAILAFCVGWWFAGQSEATDSNPIANEGDAKPAPVIDANLVPATDGAERLVGLWSESQELLATLGPASDSPSELFEEFHARDAGDSEEEAFAWMLAAVSAANGEVPKDTPEVMEN